MYCPHNGMLSLNVRAICHLSYSLLERGVEVVRISVRVIRSCSYVAFYVRQVNLKKVSFPLYSVMHALLISTQLITNYVPCLDAECSSALTLGLIMSRTNPVPASRLCFGSQLRHVFHLCDTSVFRHLCHVFSHTDLLRPSDYFRPLKCLTKAGVWFVVRRVRKISQSDYYGFVMTLRPSVHVEQLGSHWKDFYEI